MLFRSRDRGRGAIVIVSSGVGLTSGPYNGGYAANKAFQIILGEIVFAHYHQDIIDTEQMRIDPAKLDAIARLGGNTCSTIRDRFEMLTPTLADFETNLAK